MKNQNGGKLTGLVTFIGILFLLIGIYAVIRTGVNLIAFKKYPAVGVLNILPFGGGPYYPREQDCYYPAYPVFGPDGKSMPTVTEEQKKQEKEQQKVCLEGVEEARQTTKMNDVAQSVFFLFIGAGLLVSRRYIRATSK